MSGREPTKMRQSRPVTVPECEEGRGGRAALLFKGRSLRGRSAHVPQSMGQPPRLRNGKISITNMLAVFFFFFPLQKGKKRKEKCRSFTEVKDKLLALHTLQREPPTHPKINHSTPGHNHNFETFCQITQPTQITSFSKKYIWSRKSQLSAWQLFDSIAELRMIGGCRQKTSSHAHKQSMGDRLFSLAATSAKGPLCLANESLQIMVKNSNILPLPKWNTVMCVYEMDFLPVK
ncbi:hypothetical protein CEXT_634831 [Caerostris extrusa]|uniref:Uncharacterized protein n=1 Tax=Caerostris extrusa TaxID=172846 RepID=A0AAV4RCN6_CAEEX|nr:hypothetical protein CEXT_634831 [Caerostris extrusa]